MGLGRREFSYSAPTVCVERLSGTPRIASPSVVRVDEIAHALSEVLRLSLLRDLHVAPAFGARREGRTGWRYRCDGTRNRTVRVVLASRDWLRAPRRSTASGSRRSRPPDVSDPLRRVEVEHSSRRATYSPSTRGMHHMSRRHGLRSASYRVVAVSATPAGDALELPRAALHCEQLPMHRPISLNSSSLLFFCAPASGAGARARQPQPSPRNQLGTRELPCWRALADDGEAA